MEHIHMKGGEKIDAPRSWWLEVSSREDFDRAAAKELLRMKTSKFYYQSMGVVVGAIQPRKGLA